ncbi:unnamed protein product [Vicia faba]|uniref:Uncharacterized protein n=1 Tax=Vicia faba TaxID=3906 RepID=A0AAV0YP10_VICFA|nr:unnamed protein product [Vicia faba]
MKVVSRGGSYPICSSSSSWWEDLLEINRKGGDDRFVKGCCFDIGKRYTTAFWHVKWHFDKCLKDEFPRLYALSALKNVVVVGIGNWRENGVWEWSDFGILSPVSDQPTVAEEV